MRLIRLDMISLANRGLLADEIILYKILNGIFVVSSARNYDPTQQRVTRFARTFYLPFVTTNVEFNSPILRMHRQHMESFNSLNINEPNFNAFRRYVTHEIKLLQPLTHY